MSLPGTTTGTCPHHLKAGVHLPSQTDSQLGWRPSFVTAQLCGAKFIGSLMYTGIDASYFTPQLRSMPGFAWNITQDGQKLDDSPDDQETYVFPYDQVTIGRELGLWSQTGHEASDGGRLVEYGAASVDEREEIKTVYREGAEKVTSPSVTRATKYGQKEDVNGRVKSETD